MRLLQAPQLTTAVEQVNSENAPAVLIDVERALGIDMAFTWLQCGFHHPDPV
ncbi:hypothetical protein D3C85_1715670 [compost metagenome]